MRKLDIVALDTSDFVQNITGMIRDALPLMEAIEKEAKKSIECGDGEWEDDYPEVKELLSEMRLFGEELRNGDAVGAEIDVIEVLVKYVNFLTKFRLIGLRNYTVRNANTMYSPIQRNIIGGHNQGEYVIDHELLSRLARSIHDFWYEAWGHNPKIAKVGGDFIWIEVMSERYRLAAQPVPIWILRWFNEAIRFVVGRQGVDEKPTLPTVE